MLPDHDGVAQIARHLSMKPLRASGACPARSRGGVSMKSTIHYPLVTTLLAGIARTVSGWRSHAMSTLCRLTDDPVTRQALAGA